MVMVGGGEDIFLFLCISLVFDILTEIIPLE